MNCLDSGNVSFKVAHLHIPIRQHKQHENIQKFGCPIDHKRYIKPNDYQEQIKQIDYNRYQFEHKSRTCPTRPCHSITIDMRGDRQ